MKKIKVILFACLMGLVLAIPVLKKNLVKKEVPKYQSMYVLQTGVFSDLTNALNMQKKISNAVIYQDDALYRVLIGAAYEEDSLKKVEKIMNEKEIPYYKKELVLENDELLEKYNVLLKQTEDEATILLLNKKILEKVGSL